MSARGFYKLSLVTLFAVYLLILVGGIVRSTGSGMGCPDWPRCFGEWVPPTTIDQLPANYKEIYSDHRREKNIRFAQYLDTFGFTETANKILTDETILEEADFNPVKTWIEYINRLIGVIIGVFIAALFVYSIRFWKTNRSWTVVAFFTLFMVGFQGWIGSFVVSTNLTPWTITVHMFLALLIVALLVWLLHQTTDPVKQAIHIQGLHLWGLGGMLAILFQILLGTQVRESLDRIASEIVSREDWVEALGLDFVIHRSFSWLILLICGVLAFKLFRSETAKPFGLVIILLILGTIFSGTGMAYFAVPPYLQPIHLVLASVTFGTLFLLVLKLNKGKKSVL
jgi:heme a synthase